MDLKSDLFLYKIRKPSQKCDKEFIRDKAKHDVDWLSEEDVTLLKEEVP